MPAAEPPMAPTVHRYAAPHEIFYRVSSKPAVEPPMAPTVHRYAAPHEIFYRVSSKPAAEPPMAPTVHQHAAPHEIFHRVSGAVPAETKVMRPQPPEAPEPEATSDFDRIGDLGKGGFATVSKVRHRRTGDVYALKEAFHPSTHAEEEAEVLRRVARSASPFVVRCHAVFHGENGKLTSVLEFMDAGSLRSVLYRRWNKGFPEAALVEVAMRCLMGLAQLHSRGVAHLDVKPDNFLVSSRGDVKIADFNTSRFVFGRAGERLVVSTRMGTTRYFSPERFQRDPHADPRGAMVADVWGLGLTILELLLGRLPIKPYEEVPKKEDWEEVICELRAPSVPRNVKASAELRDFVDACMQKDPLQRATVPQLLKHPLITRRDAVASSHALRKLIKESLLYA